MQSTNNNSLQQQSNNLQVPSTPETTANQIEQQGLASPTLRIGQSVVTPQGTNQATPDNSVISPLSLLVLFVLVVAGLLIVIIRRSQPIAPDLPEVITTLKTVAKTPAAKKKSKTSKHRPRKKSQAKK